MLKFYRSDEGSVLAIAMIIFFISSIIGMAVLSLAAFSRSEMIDVVYTAKNRYAVESVLNKALWRINSGPDSLASFTDGNVTSQYIDSIKTLIVTGVSRGDTQQVVVELEEDFHFQRSAAFQDWLDIKKFTSFTELPDHVSRQFDFMPVLDTAYFAQNAVQIYDGYEYLNSTLTPGIHYARSGLIIIGKKFDLEGCLVVMENLTIMEQDGAVLTAMTDTAGVYLPALIVANPYVKIDFGRMDITGAVFTYGEIEYNRTQSNLTGPLVGDQIDINENLNISNPTNEQYYVWPPGFGNFDSYDWPKQIKKGTWR